MAKKIALIAVEFDDDNEFFGNSSDLAAFMEARLAEATGSLEMDLTVYSSPVELEQATKEGDSIYSQGRADKGTPLPHELETKLFGGPGR